MLNELASASDCCIQLIEEAIPVSEPVRGFCGILGLDPLTMGNEGKMVAVVDARDAERAVSILKGCRYGEQAAVIGEITGEEPKTVLLKTGLGGTRVLPPLVRRGASENLLTCAA